MEAVAASGSTEQQDEKSIQHSEAQGILVQREASYASIEGVETTGNGRARSLPQRRAKAAVVAAKAMVESDEEEKTLSDEEEQRKAKVREAQRRCRARQKATITDIQSKISSISTAIQQEQSTNTHLSTKHDLMNNLIKFKEEEIVRLEQRKVIMEKAGAVGPAACAVPEIVELMQKYTTKGGVDSVDKLLRYTPNGYTKHLGPDGKATEAPPLQEVVLEYTIIVEDMKANLRKAAEAANHKKATQQEQSSSSISQADSLERNKSNDSSDESVEHLARAVMRFNIDKIATMTDAKKEGTRSSVSSESKTTVGQSLPISTVDITFAGVDYHCSEEIVEKCVSIGFRMASLSWPAAILFPDLFMQFIAINMETCTFNEEEYNSLDRAKRIVDALDLRKDQLEELARKHYTYVEAVRPVLRQRAAIIQHLCKPNFTDPTSVQAHLEASYELGGCASALSQNIRKEYVAWCTLLAAVNAPLLFPAQRFHMWILSWPYFPNVVTLGAAAALKLGLDPSQYTFDGAGPEKILIGGQRPS